MAVRNLAKKYSDKVSEQFYQETITESMASQDYVKEFSGVNTVTIYELLLPDVGTYTRSGSNRYGTPEDLGDAIFDLQMTQDWSQTWVIDAGDAKQQFNIKEGGRTLKLFNRNKVGPKKDKYRITQWLKGTGTTVTAAAEPTASTIIGLMIDMDVALDDKNVPKEGRTYLIPSTYKKALLLADEFEASDVLSTQHLRDGLIGKFLGIPVKVASPAIFGDCPSNTYFCELYKGAIICPSQLKDYKIHDNAPGYSGQLVEWREIHDAFVLGNKRDGIGVCCASGSIAVKPSVSWSSYVATLTSSGATAIYYTDDGSDPRYSKTRKTYDSSNKPTYSSTNTPKLRVAAVKTGCYDSDILETTPAAS